MMGHAHRRAGGFTMIEVLISLIVISIGLLGIAKMQALALSSTGVASMRSLAAIEASSLGAAMHANRAYWATGTAAVTPGVTFTGTTISDANLSQAATCTTASGSTPADCSTVLLAAYDVQTWTRALVALLPNPSGTILCSNVPNEPVACTITITWSENLVAVNSQGTTGMAAQTYTLYVTP
jgi:type IV pilus assembly protein PilV